MRSLRTRTLALLAAGAVSGIGLLSSIPAQAVGTAVAINEGDPKKADTWKFNPADISVKAGSSVVWTNNGASPHTASANDSSFDTGTLKKGESKEVKFDKPGDFKYVCAFHSQMVGSVKVTP